MTRMLPYRLAATKDQHILGWSQSAEDICYLFFCTSHRPIIDDPSSIYSIKPHRCKKCVLHAGFLQVYYKSVCASFWIILMQLHNCILSSCFSISAVFISFCCCCIVLMPPRESIKLHPKYFETTFRCLFSPLSHLKKLLWVLIGPVCGSVCHSSAWDRRTGTQVALKKLHRPFQSKLFAKRAYRELRLLKHMKHENVRTNFALKGQKHL